MPTRFIKPFFTRRFVKFGMVGATGVVVNLAVLWVLRRLDVHTNVASAIAIEVSILSNFVINHLWTFKDRRGLGGPSIGQHLARFHLVSLGGGLIQFVIFVACNVIWLRWLGTDAAIAAYSAGNGTWVDHWILRPFVEEPEVGNLVYLSQIMGIGVATVWNYLLNFYWTWAKKKLPPALVEEIEETSGPTPPPAR
ncbi:MAG TPA: GtrA family protein [Polyangia bacterium]